MGRSPSGPHFVSFAPVFGRVTEPAFDAEGVVRLGTDLVNWFLVEDGGEVVVVDTGFPVYRPQLERGLALLGRSTSDVAAVVLTHAHADHTGGAEQLRRDLGVPVYIHEAEPERRAKTEASTVPYLRNAHAVRFLTHFRTSGAPEPIGAVQTFADGDELPGGLRAVHTGGHTEGHCVIHHPKRSLLFAGDLICTINPLTGARGPQLLPRALNAASGTMFDSMTRLESLEVGKILFGHGPTWTQGVAAAVRRARETGPT